MKFPIALLSLLISVSGALGQGRPDVAQSVERERTEEQKQNELVAVALGRGTFGPQREPRIISEGLLATTAKDLQDHKQFLKDANTGLIRLLPREKYDYEAYGVPKAIDIRGGGAFYSFLYQAHEYGYGSDIALDRDQLNVGFAGADFGFLTDLGSTALTDITMVDPRVAYLAAYCPPDNLAFAREEQKRVGVGFVVSGMDYRRSLPAKVGSTYLVRSIIYDRYDLLTVFTVTRKDDDGSVIIAWKRLKNFDTPRLN